MKKYSKIVGTAGCYKIRTLTRNIPIVPCGNTEYRYINTSTPSVSILNSPPALCSVNGITKRRSSYHTMVVPIITTKT